MLNGQSKAILREKALELVLRDLLEVIESSARPLWYSEPDRIVIDNTPSLRGAVDRARSVLENGGADGRTTRED